MRLHPPPFGLSSSKPSPASRRGSRRKGSPSTGSGRPEGGGLPLGSLAVCALLALAGCDREERGLSGQPKSETGSLESADPRAKEYENNAFHLAQGQRYYSWMNCNGCHALAGGGGMGPPLSDDEWRYGGRMEDIVQTILKGRPNGMPRFEGRVTEQQAWQLAAFVRSLSAQNRQDVLPGRTDDISNAEPPTLQSPQPINPESNLTLPTAEGK